MQPDFTSFRNDFFALAEKSDHIVITSHFSPDDDSIGSVLSVYTILTMRYPGKDVRIVYTGPAIERYKTFQDFPKIEFVSDVADNLGNADLLIMLDGGSFYRFSKTPDLIKATTAKTVVIDHHAGPPDEFTLSLIHSAFSSNCELIFRALDAESVLTPVLAEYFLMGILGDTGNFSFLEPSQTDVLLVAKTLIDTVGVSIGTFRSRYGGIPMHILPLLQELVKNMTYITVPGWPPCQYTYIDRHIMQEGDYSDEDMSAAGGIYTGQYVTRVQGYEWGFVVTPRADGSVRMSSRSLPGGVNVRDFHERFGIGSGHNRASGGSFKKETIDREPKQCIVEALEWMGHNAPLMG